MNRLDQAALELADPRIVTLGVKIPPAGRISLPVLKIQLHHAHLHPVDLDLEPGVTGQVSDRPRLLGSLETQVHIGLELGAEANAVHHGIV